jgi:hypothetical protein
MAERRSIAADANDFKKQGKSSSRKQQQASRAVSALKKL